MIKKIVAGVIVVAILVLAGFKLFYKGGSVNKKLKNIGENLTSYHMEANMDICLKKDDTRNFYVSVDYLKSDTDLFRISLLDKNINQEQIMLRNKEGVYVLTPRLNQVYEFKGEYPLNNQKPYLYHSIIEQVNSKDKNVEKLQDGYLVTVKPNYVNSPNWMKQDIKLSNDLKPVWINIYDNDNSLVVSVNFTKVEFDVQFSDTHFDVESNMNTSRTNVVSTTASASMEDLPLLVENASVSSTVKEQIVASVGDEQLYIIVYEGNKEFTIVQRILKDNETINVKEVSGELVELNSGLGYLQDNNLIFIYNGVEYRIYSKTLTVAELIEIANSMDIVVAK
ncbi:MAG: hypothetical protein PUA56_01935 [Bacillales bacterium]|nr:hypothetical protein [Bacillales bacterium]